MLRSQYLRLLESPSETVLARIHHPFIKRLLSFGAKPSAWIRRAELVTLTLGLEIRKSLARWAFLKIKPMFISGHPIVRSLGSALIFVGGLSVLSADEGALIKEEMEGKAEKVYAASIEGDKKVSPKGAEPAAMQMESSVEANGAPEVFGFKGRYDQMFKEPVDPMANAQQVIHLYSKVLEFHRWDDLLEKGRGALMAQQLAGLSEHLPMLPSSLDKNFPNKVALGALRADLKKLDNLLSKLSVHDIQAVSFFVRQVMIDGLVSKSNVPMAFSGTYKASLRQQSNVTEAPDGQQLVSEESGVSVNQYLRLGWALRERDWGDPSLELKLSDRRYGDDKFESREYSSLSIKGKLGMDLPGKKRKIQSLTPSLELRFDYVDSMGTRKLNNFTYAPSLDLVFRPLKGLNDWSDLFISFLNVSFEQRLYQPGFDLGSGLEEKNTFVTGTTWIGVNFDRYKDWRVKEMALLSWKQYRSDDPNLEYLSLSLDLSVAFERGWWTVKPSLAYRQRKQDQFQLRERTDHRGEFGLSFVRKFPQFESSLGLKLIDQDSDQTSLSFEDQRLTLGLSKAF